MDPPQGLGTNRTPGRVQVDSKWISKWTPVGGSVVFRLGPPLDPEPPAYWFYWIFYNEGGDGIICDKVLRLTFGGRDKPYLRCLVQKGHLPGHPLKTG